MGHQLIPKASWTWWLIHSIPELRRLKREDLKLEFSLAYIERIEEEQRREEREERREEREQGIFPDPKEFSVVECLLVLSICPQSTKIRASIALEGNELPIPSSIQARPGRSCARDPKRDLDEPEFSPTFKADASAWCPELGDSCQAHRTASVSSHDTCTQGVGRTSISFHYKMHRAQPLTWGSRIRS